MDVTSFESQDTREFISNIDFEYFLQMNIAERSYSQSEIDSMYRSYELTKVKIKQARKKNKKQYNLFLEGQVRKMYYGGFLPTMFNMNDIREHFLTDFEAVGENWAYFKYWQRFYKNKLTTQKILELITKGGSLLAIALSIAKVIELFKSH